MTQASLSDPTISNRQPLLAELRRRATNIREHALRMAMVQGQGYVGQALGVADVLAVAYFGAMRYRADDALWEDRDRFLLSIGHYAIALYAALIEAGIIPLDELETYGSDESRRALELARDMARATGARLRIVSIEEPGLRELHQAALAEDAGVDTEGVVLEGHAAELLAAQSHEVGLMIVGSRGYGPLGAVLLGGTSHSLLREAACPLIVTPRAHPGT